MDGQKEPTSNFNKVRQFVVEGQSKGLNNSVGPNDKVGKKENPEPTSKIGESKTTMSMIQSPGRRSSIDMGDMFHKPSSSSYGKKTKFTVDDFDKIRELGSGKYGRVYLVRYFVS